MPASVLPPRDLDPAEQSVDMFRTHQQWKNVRLDPTGREYAAERWWLARLAELTATTNSPQAAALALWGGQ